VLRFDAIIPQSDFNGVFVNASSLQSSMELIATDVQSHNMGQDTVFKGGNFIGQMTIYSWFINDTDLSSAQNNFNTFISSYSWSIIPYCHYWSIN
jgi:hypothetical protein